MEKRYSVTVELYIWANDAEEAVRQVKQDLGYLVYGGTCNASISGYNIPLNTDAEEIQ